MGWKESDRGGGESDLYMIFKKGTLFQETQMLAMNGVRRCRLLQLDPQLSEDGDARVATVWMWHL